MNEQAESGLCARSEPVGWDYQSEPESCGPLGVIGSPRTWPRPRRDLKRMTAAESAMIESFDRPLRRGECDQWIMPYLRYQRGHVVWACEYDGGVEAEMSERTMEYTLEPFGIAPYQPGGQIALAYAREEFEERWARGELRDKEPPAWLSLGERAKLMRRRVT